jgi:long-chain acyl-CoA synthetase
LCISGPQVPRAGHVSPNLSAFVATGLHAGDLRTGDLATLDAAGRIVVIDRVEDLIVAAGYVIYPRRIEAALLEHPGVSDAAAIGIDDGRRGQAPKAFVVLKRGLAITERDLRLFLADRISKIEMPADIDFTTRLPRTPYGLVCKMTLRRQEAARRG